MKSLLFDSLGRFVGRRLLLVSLVFAAVAVAQADPRITSWYTVHSGKYARLYQSTAAETAGSASTTWSRGAGVQSSPTFSGVSEVLYSDNWVYIRSTGLASHLMGPWYLDAAKTQLFPNFPSNTATIFRFPRNPTVPATKTLTSGGAIGYFVNGVAFFDNRDTFSYSNANGKDADPMAGIGLGDGIWNRDAYPNEAVTFDAALAHQAGNQYHYHVQPIALRYQLGDHVDYNSTTNRYTESTTPVVEHSPIVAWASDGYPVYGPYGYANATDASSGVRRMVSGFVPRDGASGTTNLNTTGRHTLAAWAAEAQGRTVSLTSGQYGPNVSGAYPLGHYLEDYDYLGDLGYAQGQDFDLDKYNGRFCVTPDFPEGTYAYFSALNADGSPAFPYNIGRQFYGSPAGGTVASITETVTKEFNGGPNLVEVADPPAINPMTGDVTLVWSAAEGGSYKVEAAPDVVTWTTIASNQLATGDRAQITEANAANANAKREYRVTRTALANFDSSGFDYTSGGGSGTTSVVPGGSGARGTSVTVTITLPTNPPQPPANLVPTSVTLAGTISGSSLSRPAQGTVLATFAIPANAPTGAQNVVVTFNPAPTYTFTGGFTIQ